MKQNRTTNYKLINDFQILYFSIKSTEEIKFNLWVSDIFILHIDKLWVYLIRNAFKKTIVMMIFQAIFRCFIEY